MKVNLILICLWFCFVLLLGFMTLRSFKGQKWMQYATTFDVKNLSCILKKINHITDTDLWGNRQPVPDGPIMMYTPIITCILYVNACNSILSSKD